MSLISIKGPATVKQMQADLVTELLHAAFLRLAPRNGSIENFDFVFIVFPFAATKVECELVHLVSKALLQLEGH